MSTPEDRLKALGLTLPTPVAPVANYVPFVLSGSQLFISGQVSVDADGGVKGTVVKGDKRKILQLKLTLAEEDE